MNKHKTIGWLLIIIGVWWFTVGIKGIYMQMDCIKNQSSDFPVCGVVPPEIGVGIFSVIPLVIGIIFLKKKDKPTE